MTSARTQDGVRVAGGSLKARVLPSDEREREECSN